MMTIKELLYDLRKLKPETEVYFDFAGTTPTTVASWRGVYAEPALGWVATGHSGNGKATTVSDLIIELETAIDGRDYTGWKGGEYSYSENNVLHIDNPGGCTNTELVRVEDNDWCVILHTRKEGDY